MGCNRKGVMVMEGTMIRRRGEVQEGGQVGGREGGGASGHGEEWGGGGYGLQKMTISAVPATAASGLAGRLRMRALETMSLI